MEEPLPMKLPTLPCAAAPHRAWRRRHGQGLRLGSLLLPLCLLAACASTPLPTAPAAEPAPAAPAAPAGNIATAPLPPVTPADLPAVAPVAPAASAPVAVAGAASSPAAATPPASPYAVASPSAEVVPAPVLDPPVVGDDTDLWQRLRNGYAMPDLDDDYVRKWEQWYASRPEYVQRMTERGGRYLFHILEEVEKRGMPADLALLPFIESAFNPQAMSRARASGMWQFMPATGRDFELRQNLFRDDRRDVLSSTRAALDYLQMLHRQFGDWHLALAAYNWGQGSVQRAIRRNQKLGLPTDYASLRMPAETRNYVPKLQAVKNIVGRPEAFALTLPALENHPFFLSLPIVRDIDVALAARLAGIELEEFQTLNPQLNKPVILAAGTPRVLLPYDNAHRFAQALAAHRGPLASWTAWTAPRTLKPAAAAQLVGLPEATLRQINNIPPRMLVKAGSTLLVPRAAHSTQDVTAHVANTAVLAFAPEARPGRRLVFKAGKRGDSVAAVARRYRVTAKDVAAWNGVAANARFKPGASVVVMVKTPAKRSTAAVRTARGAKAPVVAKAKAPVRRSTKPTPRTRVASGDAPARR
jgi:membrane-bound lytic murein transglycosylase D